MGLFDVHAHLTHADFVSDLALVLDRAREAGLTSIISNGLNLEDNRAVLDLARRESIVRPALGLYPVDAVLLAMRRAGIDYPREGIEHTAQETIAFVRDNVEEAIAIGEIGLDGHWVPQAFWTEQDEVFESLVRLAMDADKPIIVHSRQREPRALEILEDLGATRVLWHCFGSKLRLVQRIAAKGHFVSIPANARRSGSFTQMLQKLPRNRLLLETDCPYLSPVAGQRNEPAAVAQTLAYAAELWQVPTTDASQQFEDNFRQLFGCDA